MIKLNQEDRLIAENIFETLWEDENMTKEIIYQLVHYKNCHDELVEALKTISKCNRGEGLPVDVVIKMMEVLSKAESEA